MKQLAFVGMTLSLGLFSQGAVAGELIDHSAGLKLLVGADVWSTPSNVPPALQNGPMFVGNAGGLSYGAIHSSGLKSRLSFVFRRTCRNPTTGQSE